jgi:hypothetical protein
VKNAQHAQRLSCQELWRQELHRVEQPRIEVLSSYKSLMFLLFSEGTKLSKGCVESASDALDGAPGWVGAAALNEGKSPGGYAGLMG